MKNHNNDAAELDNDYSDFYKKIADYRLVD